MAIALALRRLGRPRGAPKRSDTWTCRLCVATKPCDPKQPKDGGDETSSTGSETDPAHEMDLLEVEMMP